MSAAREPLAALIQRAIEDNRLCARTLKGVCQFCGKSPHDEHTPECCFRQQENTLLAIQRGVTCSSLRAPQSGPPDAFVERVNALTDDEMSVFVQRCRAHPTAGYFDVKSVRRALLKLAGSGAESTPQPEIPKSPHYS